MKKYLSVIFVVLVFAMVSNINAPADMPEPENMSEDSFRKEDYQKLLALQFDDYRHMTVSEFQNKVWKMTDTAEYQNLLEPLTAENWQTRTYSRAAASDFPFPSENAVLEYTYTLAVRNADAVTVKGLQRHTIGRHKHYAGCSEKQNKRRTAKRDRYAG